MNKKPYLFGAFLTMISISQGNVDAIRPRVDSAHIIPLTARVNVGTLQIADKDLPHSALLVRDQLMYLVGYLNGFGGGADMAKAKITLRHDREMRDGVKELKYSAEFTVAWPRGVAVPKVLLTAVPLRTDTLGKMEFFNRFGAQCQSGDEPADAFSFFYFFRPQKQNCPLKNQYDPRVSIPIQMALEPSPLQTQNRTPEYAEIWKDKQLVVTIIVGTFADGATSSNDIGVSGYNTLYRSLRNHLGNPSTMNVPLGPNANPGLKYPDIEMTYQYSGNQSANVNLLLIQKSDLKHPSPQFLSRYHERTKVSDLVAYNGHSGLGSNIRALSRLGEFTPGHYQIFFVNGCDTFTYLDGALEEKIAFINPGTNTSKYLDLITNAMPSPFNGFSQNAISLLNGLMGKKATYRQILAGFNSFQKALVSGEEDNPINE